MAEVTFQVPADEVTHLQQALLYDERVTLVKERQDEHVAALKLVTLHYTEAADLVQVGLVFGRFLERAAAFCAGPRGSGAAAGPLSEEEAEEFYLNGDPFDGTFSPEGEDDGY